MIKQTGVFYISGSKHIVKPTKHMHLKYGKTEMKLFIPFTSQREIIPWSKIKKVQSYHEVVDKNVSVGKAVAGGVLFGPAGAILGGLMGTQGTKSSLVITYLDEENTEKELVIAHSLQIEHIKRNITKKISTL